MAKNDKAAARKKKVRKRRLATRIHRWGGIGSLAIVLVVAVTGVLLNHTESLRLNEKQITSGTILRHYGLEPEGKPEIVFRGGDHLLAVWDGVAVFDDAIVDDVSGSGKLIGAGAAGKGEFLFVFPSLVIVCDASGGLLDRLDEASLPAGRIRRAAAREGMPIMEMESGERFQLKDWIEIVPDTGPEPSWFAAEETALAESERDLLAAAFRGEGLPLSRIVLDLHSGRFFGTIGVVLYDAAAIVLIVLGITGVQLWFRRRRSS